jgi:hypothetical protein
MTVFVKRWFLSIMKECHTNFENMAEIFIFNNMQKKIENIPKKNLKK